MKVLITGGTGFIGRHIARRVVDAGHRLCALVRSDSHPSGMPKGTELAVGDVVDVATFKRAADGCDAVLHTAALVKTWVPDRSRFEAVNVAGLRNALAVSEAAGARLIYTSSFIALGPAGPEPGDENTLHPGEFRNDYERSKTRADQIARSAIAEGRDVVILYPGVVYGPGELTEGNLVVRMVLDHLEGSMPGIVGPGDRLWSYSFVDDVADGHLAALERGRPGERFVLGGENATLVDFFQTLEGLTGVPPPRRHIPYSIANVLGRALRFRADVTGRAPVFTDETIAVFRHHWAYSSSKAEAELGYRSRTLEAGLRETVDWLEESGLGPERSRP